MCNALTVHLNDEPIYDIFFANDFNSLPELLAGQGIADRRVCIVTESNVAPLYLDEIRNQLDGKCKELISIIFEAGESQKNLDTVKMIYEKLILAKFDRKDLLVALGGGVTGDITGFTAATYLRGIDFVQIPTSLLALVERQALTLIHIRTWSEPFTCQSLCISMCQHSPRYPMSSLFREWERS